MFALPGNAYALSLVRSYACLPGFDPEELVRRVKAEAAEVGRRAELVFPVPIPLPADAVLPVPEKLATVADLTLPLPPDAGANPAVFAATTTTSGTADAQANAPVSTPAVTATAAGI